MRQSISWSAPSRSVPLSLPLCRLISYAHRLFAAQLQRKIMIEKLTAILWVAMNAVQVQGLCTTDTLRLSFARSLGACCLELALRGCSTSHTIASKFEPYPLQLPVDRCKWLGSASNSVALRATNQLVLYNPLKSPIDLRCNKPDHINGKHFKSNKIESETSNAH